MRDYGAEMLFSKEKNKDHASKSNILKCNADLRAAPKPSCIAFENLAIQTQSIAKKKLAGLSQVCLAQDVPERYTD